MEEKEQFNAVLQSDSVIRIYVDSNAIQKVWQSEELSQYVPHSVAIKIKEKFDSTEN